MGALRSARPGTPPQRWRVLRLLDERDPAGGRPKALLFLTHPGPSLLVTVTTVAAARLLSGRQPGARETLRLGGVMLPTQLAIGAANDLFDRHADSTGKPFRPLPRRALPAETALAVAAAGSGLALGVAARTGSRALGLTAVGLGAGLAYDAGLKRTPLSWLTWWAGLAALPLFAATATGTRPRGLAWCVPLAGALSLSLHCANALPDLEADAGAATRSTAVTLGPAGARLGAGGGAALAALGALALPPQRSVPRWLAGLATLQGGVAAVTLAAPQPRRPFAALAVSSAALSLGWLAALPAGTAEGAPTSRG